MKDVLVQTLSVASMQLSALELPLSMQYAAFSLSLVPCGFSSEI